MLKKNLFSLASLCVAGAAGLFVVLPMSSVQAWLSRHGIAAGNYQGLAVFGLLFLAALCWIVGRATDVWLNTNRLPATPLIPPTKQPLPGWITLVQIGVSLFIMAKTTHSVFNGPLDTDETYIASSFSQGFSEAVKEINPFLSTRNHGVSSLASYLSGQFLGTNEISVRVPALIFTALFLAALFIFSNRYLSPFVVVLLYGHLCFNQVSLWYLHSMRGYAPMMAFSLFLLKLCLDGMTTGNPKAAKPVYVILFAVLTALSHTFGGFFVLALAISLLMWIGNEGRWASQAQVKVVTRIVLFLAPVIVLSGGIAASQALFIKSLGFFNAAASPDIAGESVRFFGIDGRNWLSVLLVFFGGIAWISRSQPVDSSVKLLGTLCLTGLVFSIGLASALQALALEARMCLAFLVPLIAWMGERLVRMNLQPSQIVLSMMGALTILVLPAFGRPELYNMHPEILTGYKRFIENVRYTTAPTPTSCLAVQGAPWAVGWTTKLYLVGSKTELPSPVDCEKSYLLFFETNFEPKFTLAPELRKQTEPLLSDAEGRQLFQLVHPKTQGEDVS